MNRYLTAWKSTLPASQAQAAQALLESEQRLGRLSTAEDFDKALKQLLLEIQGKLGQPVFEPIVARYGIAIDNEHYNKMLLNVNGDMNAIYGELNNVANILKSHEESLDSDVFPSLLYAIDEVESLVSVYEFLRGDTNGFTRIQYNIFNNKDTRTNRNSQIANELFYDYKQQVLIGDDCEVSEGTGVLLMPRDEKSKGEARLLDVKVDESLTSQGTSSQSFDGHMPADIKQGSQWVYEIYFNAIQNYDPVAALEFFVGSSSEINYIEITPAIQNGMTNLAGVYYTDSLGNSTPININETSLLGEEILKPIRLTFSPIFATTITIQFSQPTYKNFTDTVDTQTMNQQVSPNPEVATNKFLIQASQEFHLAGSNPGLVGAASYVYNENLLTSDTFYDVYKIEEEGIPTGGGSSQSIGSGTTDGNFSLYSYQFSVTSVSMGLEEYKESGVYVAKKEEVPTLGLIGLITDEILPLQELASLGAASYIEYAILKKDFNEADEIIKTDYFPILPFYETSVSNERIYPKDSGLASLRFSAVCPIPDEVDPTVYTDGYDIRVYRNGQLLTEGSSEDWSLYTSWERRDTWVQIHNISSNLSKTTDIYTASYTPAHLFPLYGTDGPESELYDANEELYKFYLDQDKTAYVTSDNIIHNEPYRPTETAIKSTIYLLITMRGVTGRIKRTAILNEYKMLMGVVDES